MWTFLYIQPGVFCVVHRDLKPHNILLCWNQELKGDECIERLTAKISDLGLSKKFVEAGKSVSVSKGLRGTLGWAAPEMKKGTIVSLDVFRGICPSFPSFVFMDTGL